jgi:ABC-type glycerol-3-phosphate transport system substrate-binding protein
MRKVILVLVLGIFLISVSGCLGGSSETKKETEIETDDRSMKIETETTDNGQTVNMETTIETEEGEQTVKITGTGMSEDEWCPEGGDWEMQSTGASGDATATWQIDKLVTSGEYSGLCHVIFTATTPEGTTKIDYWFDESGENGFFEMDVNGQKITQEWHG